MIKYSCPIYKYYAGFDKISEIINCIYKTLDMKRFDIAYADGAWRGPYYNLKKIIINYSDEDTVRQVPYNIVEEFFNGATIFLSDYFERMSQ